MGQEKNTPFMRNKYGRTITISLHYKREGIFGAYNLAILSTANLLNEIKTRQPQLAYKKQKLIAIIFTVIEEQELQFQCLITKKSAFQISRQKLYVFAGQGTQEKGMLSAFRQQVTSNKQCEHDPYSRIIQQASHATGIDFLEVGTTDISNRINSTQITQPLLVLSHRLHFLKNGYNSCLQPNDYMIGHSLGEYSALVNAESIPLNDCLKLVHSRGNLMAKYTYEPHGMLIVKFKRQKEDFVHRSINKFQLQIACFNTQTNIIIAGVKQKITSLAKELKAEHVGSIVLPVSTAFHCRMLQRMKQQFREQLQKYRFDKPKCQVIRNVDAKSYECQRQIRAGLLEQLTSPVQFYLSVLEVPFDIQFTQVCHKQGISKFIEEIRASK